MPTRSVAVAAKYRLADRDRRSTGYRRDGQTEASRTKTRIEPAVQQRREISSLVARSKTSPLSSERWQSEMMEWAMADERLKVELFRFVDVFPTLRTAPRSPATCASTSPSRASTPRPLRWGLGLTRPALPALPPGERLIRRQMKGFAQRFIVGRDAAAPSRLSRPAQRASASRSMCSARPSVGEAEADGYQRPTSTCSTAFDARRRLAGRAGGRRRAWGPLPRVNLSHQDHLPLLADRPGRFQGQRRRRQRSPAADLPQGARTWRRS